MAQLSGAAPDQEAAENTSSSIAHTNTVLVISGGTPSGINFVSPTPWTVDVRLRDQYVRYVSDPRPGPTAGIWRTGRDGVRERISPFALTWIEIGARGEVAITVRLPRTGDEQQIEGSEDQIATRLYQAGARLGCRADRQHIYWAIHEFFDHARRQAARGAAQ